MDLQSVMELCRPLAGKWKMELLCQIGGESVRWSVLVHRLPDAARGVLTRQLRGLERDGLVVRCVTDPMPPQVVEYRLSETGKKLLPILTALGAWCAASDRPLAG